MPQTRISSRARRQLGLSKDHNLGRGSLITLVFNALVAASPKKLAGNVAALRGTTQNLAAPIGTAVAGALLVGLLSAARKRI